MVPSRLKVWPAKMVCIYLSLYKYIYTIYIHIWLRFSDGFTTLPAIKIKIEKQHPLIQAANIGIWPAKWGHGADLATLDNYRISTEWFHIRQWISNDSGRTKIYQDIWHKMGVCENHWKPLTINFSGLNIQHSSTSYFEVPAGPPAFDPFIFIIRNLTDGQPVTNKVNRWPTGTFHEDRRPAPVVLQTELSNLHTVLLSVHAAITACMGAASPGQTAKPCVIFPMAWW